VKVSDKTIEILKNFSTINQGIVIKADTKELNTVTPIKNILAHANIDEDFPETFAIYDLNEFLNTLSLFKEPVLEFNQTDYVKIKEENGRSSCRYFFSDPSIITSVDKKLKMPKSEINFDLSDVNLAQILKACNIMQLPDISITRDDDDVIVRVQDKKNDMSNSYDLVVGEYDGSEDFSMDLKSENIKLISDGYSVSISSKNISHFKSANKNVEYWIAVEKSSTFG